MQQIPDFCGHGFCHLGSHSNVIACDVLDLGLSLAWLISFARHMTTIDITVSLIALVNFVVSILVMACGQNFLSCPFSKLWLIFHFSILPRLSQSRYRFWFNVSLGHDSVNFLIVAKNQDVLFVLGACGCIYSCFFLFCLQWRHWKLNLNLQAFTKLLSQGRP